MIAKIWNFSGWIKLTAPEQIKQYFEKLLGRAGLTVLSVTEHKFEPQGYTILFLLAESHFAVHTFPEQETSYIELSSCNGFKQKMFIKLLKQNTVIYKERNYESSK